MPPFTIAQQMDQVSEDQRWWTEGQAVEVSANDETRDFLPGYGRQTKQVTYTVSDQADGVAMPITIGGQLVEYSAGVGLGDVALAAEHAAAIELEPLVRSRVTASASGTTVTLTALHADDDFSVVLGTGQSALTVVRAVGTAQEIPWGRAICEIPGKKGLVMRGALAGVDLFTAQVVTVTPSAYQAGATLTVRVYEVRGDEKRQIASVAEVSAVNLATTLAALAAGLNGASELPANTVDVTATATTIVFTAELKGLEFAVEMTQGDESGTYPSAAIAATVGPSISTSLHRALRGVSIKNNSVGQLDGRIGAVNPRYRMFSAKRRGLMAVAHPTAIEPGQRVYVELAVGADQGKFYNSPGSTRIGLPLDRAMWEVNPSANTGLLAGLRVMM
jgi:hypothetical protein